MFVVVFDYVCGVGDTVDLAMEDLRNNYTYGDTLEDDDVVVYQAKQVKVTKTWIVEPL